MEDSVMSPSQPMLIDRSVRLALGMSGERNPRLASDLHAFAHRQTFSLPILPFQKMSGEGVYLNFVPMKSLDEA